MTLGQLNALAKVLALSLSTASSFTALAIISQRSTASQLGYVLTIAAIAQLLPIADLGMGAAVLNAFRRSDADDSLQEAMAHIVAILWRSAAVLTVVALSLATLSAWNRLIGWTGPQADEANIAVALVVVVYASSIPFSVSHRVLLACNQAHYSTLITGASAIASLGILAVLYFMEAPTPFLAIGPVSTVLVGSLGSTYVCFRLTGFDVWLSIRQGWRRAVKRIPQSWELWQSALPMLIIMLTLPLGIQGGRYVLAHLSSPAEVASFAVLSQFYIACYSLVSAAGMTLWPYFAALTETFGAWRAALWRFGIFGLLLAAPFVLLANPAADTLTHGKVSPDLAATVGFAALLVIQSLHQASAYLLTDHRGLRLQALFTTVVGVGTLASSAIIVPHYGAAGLIWAFAILQFALHTLPQSLLIIERNRRGE